MASFLTDNDDLRFYLDRGIDWDALVEVTEYGYRAPDCFKNAADARAFYGEIAAMMGELVAKELGPRAAKVDREDNVLANGEVTEGPSMRAFFDALKAAEVHGLCLPRELGGLNAPLTLYFLVAEMIARGDVSAMTHFSFHGGMAMAMLAYSIHEGSTRFDVAAGRIAETRFASYIDEIARGEAWGCMDITEPDAGSDMARLRCRAEQGADGTWRLHGEKIFITSGHGKFHFVIARTEEAQGDDALAGLQGLSMFLAKAYDDLPDGTRVRHVEIARIEEKLGHHGSVTAALVFDGTPAELVGQRGEGFKYMLTLMNNARVGVAFEGIGLSECALRMAREYAAGRTSMGKPIARHEMIADMLDEMETDVLGLRALAATSAFHEEMAQKLALLDRFNEVASADERARSARDLPWHRARSRRFTPLLKYLSSEKAVEIARRNVQIHGGVGYTKEYGAEKLLRDALVLPIYEGTSQIQSLMAMKDTLGGIVKRPQAFVRRLAKAQWRAVSAPDALERRVAAVSVLSLSAQRHLMTRTAADKFKRLGGQHPSTWKDSLTKQWDPKRDFALAMLHAERLTRLLADEAVAEVLLEQAQKHPDRRPLLERWLDRCELRDRGLHEAITTTGEKLLARLAEGA